MPDTSSLIRTRIAGIKEQHRDAAGVKNSTGTIQTDGALIMQVVIDYVVGYVGGTCTGSYLLDGCRPPEVGDVIQLFVRKGKSPVTVDLVAPPSNAIGRCTFGFSARSWRSGGLERLRDPTNSRSTKPAILASGMLAHSSISFRESSTDLSCCSRADGVTPGLEI